MISSEIIEKVNQVIEGKTSIEELEEWLVPRLPFYVKVPVSPDANAVAFIELDLAELNAGIQTLTEFRLSLQQMLQENDIVVLYEYPERSNTITTSSDNELIQVQHSDISYSPIIIQ